jgi:hypothetical protein
LFFIFGYQCLGVWEIMAIISRILGSMVRNHGDYGDQVEKFREILLEIIIGCIEYIPTCVLGGGEIGS